MTGATGDLTPDDSDRAFVPGERREIEDADARASVTVRQGAAAPAQQRDVGRPVGELHGGPTELAERESGDASEAGLAADDPVPARGRRPAAPRLAPDQRSEHEERF